MLVFAEKYKHNFYSQNGEDGILIECFQRMNVPPDWISACEFGAHDGLTNSNTRHLVDLGAKGLFIEANEGLYQQLVKNTEGKENCTAVQATVSPDNINDLVPAQLDLLSIDVDGRDFRLWQAYKGQARIVIVEINSSFHPRMKVTGTKGSSFPFMLKLGMQKGYFLLCHVGNMIFVQNEYRDLFPEITSDPVTQADDYFDYRWINGVW